MAQHLKELTASEVVKLINEFGLKVSSVHDGGGVVENEESPIDFINPSLDTYLSELGYAPDCIVFHVPHTKGGKGVEWWERYRKDFANILDKYRRHCRFITIENIPTFEGYYVPLLTPQELERFATENNLGVTLDTTQYAQIGVDIVEEAQVLRRSTRSIHLSDFVDGRSHLFIGDGILSFADYFKVIDFSMLSSITLECSMHSISQNDKHVNKGQLVSMLKEAKCRLEQLLNSTGNVWSSG